jgi:hypothetical protein
MYYLANIVEVPVRNSLLSSQFPQLIEQHVELELVGEVGQTTIAETLQRT